MDFPTPPIVNLRTRRTIPIGIKGRIVINVHKDHPIGKTMHLEMLRRAVQGSEAKYAEFDSGLLDDRNVIILVQHISYYKEPYIYSSRGYNPWN